VPTVQSSAFLNAPGIPCAYSGTEISRPAASTHARSNRTTVSGGAASRSGSKWGSDRAASLRSIAMPAAAPALTAARSAAVLTEDVRRLPEIARIGAGDMPGRTRRPSGPFRGVVAGYGPQEPPYGGSW
jgi:hypothetical protein